MKTLLDAIESGKNTFEGRKSFCYETESIFIKYAIAEFLWDKFNALLEENKDADHETVDKMLDMIKEITK